MIAACKAISASSWQSFSLSLGEIEAIVFIIVPKQRDRLSRSYCKCSLDIILVSWLISNVLVEGPSIKFIFKFIRINYKSNNNYKNHILLKKRHSYQQTMTWRQNIIMVAGDTYKVLLYRSSTTFLKDFLPVGTLLGLMLVAFILLNRSSIALRLYFKGLTLEEYLHHKAL